jgi:hypothetical protein
MGALSPPLAFFRLSKGPNDERSELLFDVTNSPREFSGEQLWQYRLFHAPFRELCFALKNRNNA